MSFIAFGVACQHRNRNLKLGDVGDGVFYWNPFDQGGTAYSVSLNGRRATAANLNPGGRTTCAIAGGLARSTGKRYLEFKVVSGDDTGIDAFGLCMGLVAVALGVEPNGAGNPANSIAFTSFGRKYNSNTTNAATGIAIFDGDTLGVAADLDAGKVWFLRNNVAIGGGDPVAGTTPTCLITTLLGSPWRPFTEHQDGDGGAQDIRLRLKASEFAFTPPVGFAAWL